METGAYREALREAHRRAAAVLRKSPHAPTDATMRRVMATLSAVAASGSFDPDPPGALTADREPPGFEAIDTVAATTRVAKPERTPAQSEDRAKKQAEAKARQAERQRLVAALREAQAMVRDTERASALLKKELQAAEKAVEDARDALRDLERKLAKLDGTD
jgi:primosomal protein N''